MPDNIYLRNLLLATFAVLIFVGAIVAYWLFFAFFPKIFRKDGLTKRLVKVVKVPLLFLLLELAAFLALNLFEIPTLVDDIASHIILIFSIATVGWLLGALVKTAYRYLMHHYEKESIADLSKRSMLTQLQFLYRALMFMIVVLSLASILITFPAIKSVGVGILGSAGIMGIALGIAARPILLNFMAGFQIAITKAIKIGDAVIIEGEWGRIEHIYLTHVIVKIWDLRRLVVPISYFIDNPFQNWTCSSTDLIGVAYIYCDYTVPVTKVREKLEEILKEAPLWDQKVWNILVTDITERTVQLRAIMSASDASNAFMLRCYVREKLLEFLQKEYPSALPQMRIEKKESPKV